MFFKVYVFSETYVVSSYLRVRIHLISSKYTATVNRENHNMELQGSSGVPRLLGFIQTISCVPSINVNGPFRVSFI